MVQKSGINAKNDNVKVLGIRVREVMHDRRIELLESAAVQPGKKHSHFYASLFIHPEFKSKSGICTVWCAFLLS